MPRANKKRAKQDEGPTCANGTPVRKIAVTAFQFMNLPSELRVKIYHAAFELHEHPSDYLGLMRTCKEAHDEITALRIRPKSFHLPARSVIFAKKPKKINKSLSHSGTAEETETAQVQRLLPVFFWGRDVASKQFKVSLQTVATSPAFDLIIDPAWGDTVRRKKALRKILTRLDCALDQEILTRLDCILNQKILTRLDCAMDEKQMQRLVLPRKQNPQQQRSIVAGIIQQMVNNRVTKVNNLRTFGTRNVSSESSGQQLERRYICSCKSDIIGQAHRV